MRSADDLVKDHFKVAADRVCTLEESLLVPIVDGRLIRDEAIHALPKDCSAMGQVGQAIKVSFCSNVGILQKLPVADAGDVIEIPAASS